MKVSTKLWVAKVINASYSIPNFVIIGEPEKICEGDIHT